MTTSEDLKDMIISTTDLTMEIILRSSQVDTSKLLKLQQVILTSVTSHVTGNMALIEQEIKTKVNSDGYLHTARSTFEIL